MSYIINGANSKRVELWLMVDEEKPTVLALQETLLTPTHWPLRLPGYDVYQSYGSQTALSLRQEDYFGVDGRPSSPAFYVRKDLYEGLERLIR